MQVKELIEILKSVDPKRLVVIQKDSEGNDYSPLAGAEDNAVYQEKCGWAGDVKLERLTPKLKKAGYTDEDLGTGVKALLLFPVN